MRHYVILYSSAMPRVRARRSSLVQSPFSPPIEPDGPPVGRRGRSQSVFTSPSSSRYLNPLEPGELIAF